MNQFCRIVGFALVCAGVSILVPTTVNAQTFGSFTLKPGEARDLHIDAADHMIRLCNNRESAGVLYVTIDNHDTRHVPPSDCIEEFGSDINIRNMSGGTVKGAYSRMYYLND